MGKYIPDFWVPAEEFKFGGKTSSNQKVLAFSEIQANQKQNRIRLIPIPDKICCCPKIIFQPWLRRLIGCDLFFDFLRLNRIFNQINKNRLVKYRFPIVKY